MANRANNQCDRCGRFFVGARGVATHQRIGTRCVPMEPNNDFEEFDEIDNDEIVNDEIDNDEIVNGEIDNNEIDDAEPAAFPNGLQNWIREDSPVLNFDTPNEELLPLTEIEGYSLEYLKIPANIFLDLENEEPQLGRFESLRIFAQRVTASQTRIMDYPVRLFYVTLNNLFWLLRIFCIIFLALSFYYTDSPSSCSAEINHFLLDIEKNGL